jgi:hypothetical protein
MSKKRALAKISSVESRIRLLRGCRVMLDSDLAELYGVETRALVQAVKRNRSRFPDDFMFQLTQAESRPLRSQTVISSEHAKHGGRRYAPHRLAAKTRHAASLRNTQRSQIRSNSSMSQLARRKLCGHGLSP